MTRGDEDNKVENVFVASKIDSHHLNIQRSESIHISENFDKDIFTKSRLSNFDTTCKDPQDSFEE